MAAALFPLLDGETISSNIARYAESIGIDDTSQLRRRLFGYACKPDTRLPSGMSHLAEETRDYWCLSAADIIKNNTEFYYATATVPVKHRESMLSNMLKQPAGRCLQRSASGWIGERVTKFRYCDDCRVEWRKKKTSACWMVDHQLPGVYICSGHSSLLTIVSGSSLRYPADLTVMALKGRDDKAALARVSSTERVAIRDVSINSSKYRMAKGSLPSATTYRELLRLGGFLWSTGGVDACAFATSIFRDFGSEYCQSVGLSLQRITAWLRNIAYERKDEAFSHPFMSILAESLLTRRCMAPGSFTPAIHCEDVFSGGILAGSLDIQSSKEIMALSCHGMLHRNKDGWIGYSNDGSGYKLLCSCGVAYKASETSRNGEVDLSVRAYGERYQGLIAMRFADNFSDVHSSRGFHAVNPQFLRWARHSGFFRSKTLAADAIQNLRDQWQAVVRRAPADKRITWSYRANPKLYRTLYRYDKSWITEFNRKNRAHHVRSQAILDGTNP